LRGEILLLARSRCPFRRLFRGGLAGPIGLILPALREQTNTDALLQHTRFLDERVELTEERGQFLGGEKALLAHTKRLSRRIAKRCAREKQSSIRISPRSRANGITIAFKIRRRLRKAMRTQGQERRNISARAAIVQRVINGVVQNPSVTLTVDTLQAWLDIPLEAAQRILDRLASSGLVREVQKGVWARGTWPGTQRDWY
jgi:hypothetical protein